jgi:hypothetical protein
MLFDLKGKRRRTVQGIYLTLAILMGAGLVLFGIGSSVNGGLFDAFNGGGGSNQADKTIQKRIDAANRTLASDPKNTAALALLVRSHYQLATSKSDPNSSQLPKSALPELQSTADAWKRYEAAAKKPDPSLASVAIQTYSGMGTLTGSSTAWAGAADATETLASVKPSVNAYVTLVQYATLAGQTRKADLAANQAVRMAPKSEKKAVQNAIKQAKSSATQQGQGTQPATGQ